MILDGNQAFFELKDVSLYRSVLNEVLNGFVVDDFDAVIGMTPAELQQLLTQLNGLPEDVGIKLDLNRTRAFRNALRITLSELGVEEFHTRTGFDFQEGKRLLMELDGRLQES
jgi:hypothetical protein